MNKIIKNQSNQEYHQNTEYVGSSSLKEMSKSPKHFYAAWKGVKDETPAMIKGQLIHSVVLEQDLSKFAKRPLDEKGSLVRSNSKEYAAWLATVGSKTPVDPDLYDEAQGFLDSFCGHSEAMKLYNKSEVETSLYCKDEKTGVLVKARPDIMGLDYIADLKSTSKMDRFNSDIFSLGYHIQAGHYVAVAEQVTGKKIRNYFFIAQESSAPYGIKVFRMNREMIEFCIDKRNELLNRVSIAIEKNEFTGYAEIVEDVRVPKWIGVGDDIFEGVG